MNFCNLVKLMDQYCGKKFLPCRGFQYEVTEASKWPDLFHVKGSQAVHPRSNRTWPAHCRAPRYVKKDGLIC